MVSSNFALEGVGAKQDIQSCPSCPAHTTAAHRSTSCEPTEIPIEVHDVGKPNSQSSLSSETSLVVALLESYGNPDSQLRTVTSPAPNRVDRVYERDQPTPQFEDSKKKLSTILTGDILVKLYLPMTSSEPTFGPLTTKRPSAGGTEFDDLDDLFSYDVGDENDPFSENYKPLNKNDATKESTSK